MGCLFSSSPSEESGDRHRKNPQLEDPLIPNSTNSSTNQTSANAADTSSPALTMGARTPAKKQPGAGFTPRVLGTSFTDKQQREKHNFQNIVQQARQAFIDISAQQRAQVSPLSPQALSLTAQCEILLSSEPVPNLRNGFFESRVPNTVFTSIDNSPNSNAENSVDNIVNAILEPPNFPVVELAYACAQEACYALVEGTVQVVQNSLVIGQAEFEETEN